MTDTVTEIHLSLGYILQISLYQSEYSVTSFHCAQDVVFEIQVIVDYYSKILCFSNFTDII